MYSDDKESTQIIYPYHSRMVQDIQPPKQIKDCVHLIVCKFKLWNGLELLYFSQFILKFVGMNNFWEQKYIDTMHIKIYMNNLHDQTIRGLLDQNHNRRTRRIRSIILQNKHILPVQNCVVKFSK